jgi:hypothetical protein
MEEYLESLKELEQRKEEWHQLRDKTVEMKNNLMSDILKRFSKDVLFCVFHKLDIPSLNQCCKVCKNWYVKTFYSYFP